MKLLKSLNREDLAGKKVFLRLDLNVPVSEGKIIDKERILRSKPTVDYLLKNGALVVIASHFGRPEGKHEEKYSLKFLTEELSKIFCHDVIFNDLNSLSHGKIILLENLRFDSREEINSEEFAKELASLADIYVNDAFSCSHRAHASVCAITKFLPSYGGLLLEEEISYLDQALSSKLSPSVVIVAGKKVSTKFEILNFLVKSADTLIIGGAMANTFLKALGYDIGNSYYESDFLDLARDFYKQNKEKIYLPNDFAVEQNNQVINKSINEISEDDVIYDLGSNSVSEIETILKNSKLVLWNGPLGFYEDSRFIKATKLVAHTIAHLTKANKITSIAGGGDIVAALELCGLKDSFTYVSTAGGAFLEYLEGKSLPALRALD